MLKPILSSTKEGKEALSKILNRDFDISKYEEQVKNIFKAVIEKGDDAIIEYTNRFDSPHLKKENLLVSSEEIEKAYKIVPNNFIKSLKKSIEHVKEFHKHQLTNSWMITREDGSVLGQLVKPVETAGLYVPGGKGGNTPLCSSVVMNGIPAVIAGVKKIIMATPPNQDGQISPYLIVAAKEVGIQKIYKMGSAWAIFAMAYGTESVEKVDVIVGPGNIFVTVAKKMVSGKVGIDMIAGPSEILIIADKNATPSYIAADLLSQAEHDTMATAILLTDSKDLAHNVSKELKKQLDNLTRYDIAQKSLETNGAIIIVDDIEEAIDIANQIAPEHLEIMVKEPWQFVGKINNAGAIFLGEYTPEPIGDYIAGANHVLPTMGTAKFSSALGVETFIKRSSIISYSKASFIKDANDVICLADVEGLGAHANSISVRLQNSTKK